MKAPIDRVEVSPIGHLESCFKEKFGIPRQPGLVEEARGTIVLRDDPDLRTALRELDGFSHLWVIFLFHEHGSRNWKPSIRPPRLGGARKVGVLASRSPHRPNPIGLSVVKILSIQAEAPGGPRIEVAGVDMLDGTPVLDIKPYLPYADSIPDAKAGWADEPIRRTPVEFSEQAEAALAERARKLEAPPSEQPEQEAAAREGYTKLKKLIVEMLELDPRPAFQKRRMPVDSPEAQGARFGFKLLDFDVKWEIRDGKFRVLDLTAPHSKRR